MEGLKKEELMKRRGYIATMEAAYRFVADNFKTILKVMWPYFLITSIVLGIYFILQLNTSMKMMSDPTDISGSLAALALLPILFIAYLFIYGKLLTLYNDQSVGWNMLRYIKLTLWLALIFTVALIIFFTFIFSLGGFNDEQSATGDVISLGKTLLLGLLFSFIAVAILLPYIYVSMKYVVETKSHFRHLIFKGWLKGMRHWGYIFVTTLLLYICLAIIGIIIYIPLYICGMAFYMSANGMAQGDPSGVPSYFTILVFLIIVLTYFVYLFISVYAFTVFYYMYGNIETYEREKEMQQLPIEPAVDETTENTVY